jgi:hypothetical protein
VKQIVKKARTKFSIAAEPPAVGFGDIHKTLK